MAYGLGIDIGTTFSAAAVAFDDGRIELVNLGGRAASIPSVVYIGASGESLAGDAAEARAAVDPTRIAREFKRRLGDPTPLILGGTAFSAESLTTTLLRHVLDHVVRRMGGPPASVVVTHPASYSAYRLELLRNAAAAAGIANPLLISEPAAAAAQYESMAPIREGEIIAVYDFGGGTFDIALLRRRGTGFELMDAPSGVDRLGGIDFDLSLVRHVDDALGGALGRLDPEDEQTLAVLAKLRRDCRDAKETLSSDSEAYVSVIAPGTSSQVRITRAELEALIRPRLAETFAALRAVVDTSGITVEDITRILLVGGSSRIPLIREEVRLRTGRPVAEDIDSEHAVALGAARLAARPLRVQAPRPVVAPPSPPPPAPPVAFQPAVAPVAAPGPDRRKLALIGGAAAVIVAIVVGFLVFSGGDDDETATTDETDETVEETDPEDTTEETDATTPVTETVATTVDPATTLLVETSLAPETTVAVTAAPTLPPTLPPVVTTVAPTIAPSPGIDGVAIHSGLNNFIARTGVSEEGSALLDDCPAGDLVALSALFADVAPLALSGETVQSLFLDDGDFNRDSVFCTAFTDAGQSGPFLGLGIQAVRPDIPFDLEQQEIVQSNTFTAQSDDFISFAGGQMIGYCKFEVLCGATWFDDAEQVAISLDFSGFEDAGFDVAIAALQAILPSVAEGVAKL